MNSQILKKREESENLVKEQERFIKESLELSPQFKLSLAFVKKELVKRSMFLPLNLKFSSTFTESSFDRYRMYRKTINVNSKIA
jgi:hypothetical protein